MHCPLLGNCLTKPNITPGCASSKYFIEPKACPGNLDSENIQVAETCPRGWDREGWFVMAAGGTLF